MVIELKMLTTDQLSRLQKRYLKIESTSKEKALLNRVGKELLRRKKLIETVNFELKGILHDHPQKELITDEIKNRCRLNMLDRESKLYGEIYHKWFAERIKGIELKLYRWLIPIKNEL